MAKRRATLDTTRAYGQVIGDPIAKFEQDGKIFSKQGKEIFSGEKTAPKAEAVAVAGDPSALLPNG